MKSLLIITIIFFTCPFLGVSQSFDWVYSAGDGSGVGESYNEGGNSIILDDEGNIYVSGFFTGTTNFDPNGDFLLTATGDSDFFILKLDVLGNFLWVTSFGSNQSTSCNLALDSENNIYCVGKFSGQILFGDNHPPIMSIGFYDSYIIKFDTNGAFQWVKILSGDETLKVNIKDIVVDSQDSVILIGSYQGIVDFDLTDGEYFLNSESITDAFIMKIDINGNLIWVNHFDDRRYDEIVVDDFDNIYITGVFSQNNSGGQILVNKLNAFGELVWLKTTSAINDDEDNEGWGGSIDTDSEGNVYITGGFSGVLDFDPSEDVYVGEATGWESLFLLKLNTEGEFEWVKLLVEGNETLTRGTAIKVTLDDEILLAGYFVGEISNDNGPIEGLFDMFVMKIDAQSVTEWTNYYISFATNTIRDIEIDTIGNFFLTGSYGGVMDFDAEESTYEVSAIGSFDIFILKLNCISSNSVPLVSENDFGVYPSPTIQMLTVDLSSLKVDFSKIEMYSSRGELLFREEDVVSSKRILIDVSDLVAGVYSIYIYEENNRFLKKFVKM